MPIILRVHLYLLNFYAFLHEFPFLLIWYKLLEDEVHLPGARFFDTLVGYRFCFLGLLIFAELEIGITAPGSCKFIAALILFWCRTGSKICCIFLCVKELQLSPEFSHTLCLLKFFFFFFSRRQIYFFLDSKKAILPLFWSPYLVSICICVLWAKVLSL